jgi:hypothetical protein
MNMKNIPTSTGQFTVPGYVMSALPAGNAAGYISYEVNSIFN